MNTHKWTLADLAYDSFHQWPKILALFLAGCLVGLAVSLIWPASYRAEADIYIGLNPYRVFSDTTFLSLARPKYTNVDDYKNWQMSQLMAVIFLDEVIEETLTTLRTQDSYWESIDASQLRSQLSTEWRTAGRWSLAVEDPSSQHADMAAYTWSEVVYRRVSEAVLAARQMFTIDDQQKSLLQIQVETEVRQQELSAAREQLEDWLEQSAAYQHPLEPLERWRIISLVSRGVPNSQAWDQLWAALPSPDASRQAHRTWVSQALPAFQSEEAAQTDRLQVIAAEHQRLETSYQHYSDLSLGLSPNLELKQLEHQPATKDLSRELVVLMGGLLAITGWFFAALVRITWQESSQ